MKYRILEDPYGDTGFKMFRIQQKIIGIWVPVRDVFGENVEDAKKIIAAWEYNAANKKVHYCG